MSISPRWTPHYIVAHLGGPKRIERRGEGASRVAEAEADALTIVPAGAAYAWRTQGPIEYAHLYILPEQLRQAAEAIFDRDGRTVAPIERLATQDAALAGLFHALIAEGGKADADRLYLDVLGEALTARLLKSHTDLEATRERARLALSPKRLADVIDFIDSHLADAIALDDLAAVARLSRFHFSRAFTRSTGVPPHAFVVSRRLDRARLLLRTTGLPIEAVAAQCGFRASSHFASRFRRAMDVTPTAYRQGW